MDDSQQGRLTSQVMDFLRLHRIKIERIVKNANNLFETQCYVIFVRYYESVGYKLEPRNLQNGKFRFRYSTNGFPWRYSYFLAYERNGESDEPKFEIWHNQKVAGAWVDYSDVEKAQFAVDVAVTRAGALPADLPFRQRRSSERIWVDQKDLFTFGEAKNLGGYPMLLAQFLGSVHEIKPAFIRVGRKKIEHSFATKCHLPPILMTANVLMSGAVRVLGTFRNRKLALLVADGVAIKTETETLESIRTNLVPIYADLKSHVSTADKLSTNRNERLKRQHKRTSDSSDVKGIKKSSVSHKSRRASVIRSE